MDAGNFFVDTKNMGKFGAWEKGEFIWDMMAKVGYDAVTPGDFELLYGIDAITGLYSRQPIEVVSANIMDGDGNLIFPKYTVIEKGGVRFGVTGTTGSVYYSFNVKRGYQKKDEFTFRSSAEALKEVIPELEPQCDILVVLLHEGAGDARRLLDEIEGIDVMVVGHNPGYMFNPDRVEDTLILRPGNKGQYLSVLQLTLDESKTRILDYNGEGKPLGDGVAKDSEVEPVVRDWEDDFKERGERDKRAKAAEKALLQGTEKYLGAEVCGRCHYAEYSSWAETAHARAYQSLVGAEKQQVEDCLECHVVGLGEPTGYELNWLTDKKGERTSSTDIAALRNVQCESCHGMGTFHGTDAMNPVPDEESCRTCHFGEFDKGFNYAEAIANGAVH